MKPSLSRCVANEENSSARMSIHVAYGVYNLSINVIAIKRNFTKNVIGQLEIGMANKGTKNSQPKLHPTLILECS